MGRAMVAAVAIGLIATFAMAQLYRMVWRRFRGVERTPSGFGALLAPVMLIAATIAGVTRPLEWSLIATAAGTLVYWFDDAIEISARLRVGIAIATGCVIGLAYMIPAGFSLPALIVFAAAAGFVHMALVNVVNFQDGADLNLATFIILTGVLMLAYAPEPAEWVPLAIGCLVFVLPFAVINSRPRSLYFGDSGSFAFAAVFTIMGVAFLFGQYTPPPEAAIPAALPVVDTAFVTAHRVRIRQRFTTRHYFHLYQRLQTCRPGFTYLMPQLVCAALCLAAATGLQATGLGRILSVTLSIAVISPAFFLAARRWWVEGEPGPPPVREVRP